MALHRTVEGGRKWGLKGDGEVALMRAVALATTTIEKLGEGCQSLPPAPHPCPFKMAKRVLLYCAFGAKTVSEKVSEQLH